MPGLTGKIHGLETKDCRLCRLTKPLESSFGRHKNSRGGYRHECKACCNKIAKASRSVNPRYVCIDCRSEFSEAEMAHRPGDNRRRRVCVECFKARKRIRSLTCTGCDKHLPLAAFPKVSERKSMHARTRKCIECARLNRTSLGQTEKYRARARETWLRKNYGITTAQYEAMVADQDGVCAICHQAPTANRQHGRLVVDHCHKTGKIRGLLCDDCNVGVGRLHDSVDNALGMIHYLRRNQENRNAGA